MGNSQLKMKALAQAGRTILPLFAQDFKHTTMWRQGAGSAETPDDDRSLGSRRKELPQSVTRVTYLTKL
jgi:hypothetical protein